MGNVKISVIIPVYNVENYLKKCVDSIINQTLKDLEIILVNNGSTDTSGLICDNYSKVDNRVVVIKQDNLGPSGGRNTGISVASGEYIMFVDSDDWIEPETCETAYQLAIKNDADFIFWSYYNESSIGTKIKNIYIDKQIVYNADEVKAQLLSGVLGLTEEKLKHPEKLDALVPVWARLYKTSIIKENNIAFIDLNLIPSECQQFNFDYLMYSTKSIYINKAMYHYRRNSISSFTKGYRTDLLKKWIYWIEKNKRIVEKKENSYLLSAYYSRICFSVIPLGGNAIKNENFVNTMLEIKNFLNHPYYKTAYNNFDFKYLPMHWKLFFWFLHYD